MKQYTQPKEAEMNCPVCKKITKVEKTQCIRLFPKYLILQVEKFKQIGWVPMKLHNSVKFQDLDNVDLSALRLP